jgi:hypothetical protein
MAATSPTNVVNKLTAGRNLSAGRLNSIHYHRCVSIMPPRPPSAPRRRRCVPSIPVHLQIGDASVAFDQ